MSIFRSEDMNLLKLVMSKDQEYPIVDLIGQLELAHFVNVNEAEEVFLLPYSIMIQRCEEAERKLLFVLKQCEKHGIPLERVRTVEQLSEVVLAEAEERKTAVSGLFERVEKQAGELETFIVTQNEQSRSMREEMNHLLEYYSVLRKSAEMLFGERGDADGGANASRRPSLSNLNPSMTESVEELLLHQRGKDGDGSGSDGSDDQFFDQKQQEKYESGQSERSESSLQIAYTAGSISATEQRTFEKLIFRMSRGKVLARFHERSFELKDFDGQIRTRTAFVLVYQDGAHIRERITKVCTSFQAKIFELPEGGQRGRAPFKHVLKEVKSKIAQVHSLIDMTAKQMKDYLVSIQQLNDFPEISCTVFLVQYLRREKSIFACLNMLQRQGQLVHGYIWTNLSKEKFLQKFNAGPGVGAMESFGSLVNDGHEARSFNLQIEEIDASQFNPPTHFKTNAFTKYFQMVVDQYAVPSYKEINPAIYTIISFPFLFGVMYGDVGHGSVLLAVAVFLMLFGGSLSARIESLRDVYEFRYMLFLMAFFSVYCGFMYNDFMSLPLNLFKSCYDKTGIRIDEECVYPVGIDPIWYGSKQELPFMNSFKMKMSVILAIFHMTLGIFQQGLNAIYFKDNRKLMNQFLPQLILLLSIFGYMDVLIILKWNTDYTGRTDRAPSVIVTIVNFFLNGGAVKGDEFFTGNQHMSQILLLVAMATIPWMLLVNPYLIWKEENDKKKQRNAGSGDVELQQFAHGPNYEVPGELDGEENVKGAFLEDDILHQVIGKRHSPGHHSGDDEEFDMVAIGINSMIHTIEFALGTISNTASYLRLWALSLAHSQLAKVFYDMLLAGAIEKGSIIGLFIGFFIWASATFGVLLGMDFMEVMLHTVRLHWVEFMSKFFEGEGYAYSAFSFQEIVDDLGLVQA